MIFRDRTEAGVRLAGLLKHYRGKNAIIYALPRGGVLVGKEIAEKLNAPLDLIIARKIGHPLTPEYAIGATTENGSPVFNNQEIINIDPDWLEKETYRQKLEAKRRRELYVGGREPLSCTGKIAILIDDGIATGLTMKTAINDIKLRDNPNKIIVGLPIVPGDIAEELEKTGVEVVSVITDKYFLGAVGAYYKEFPQVKDEEVREILEEYQ